jgi:hypothetical protein
VLDRTTWNSLRCRTSVGARISGRMGQTVFQPSGRAQGRLGGPRAGAGVLDHDVDVLVGVVLQQAGHECWPSAAGLAASADDDAVAVYADESARVPRFLSMPAAEPVCSCCSGARGRCGFPSGSGG